MQALRITVKPETTRFDTEDERWFRQVLELQGSLHGIQVLSAPEPATLGSKGSVIQVLIELGSVGAYTAAVQVLQAWLTKDRGRKIIIEFFKNGKVKSVELTGQAAPDKDALHEMYDELLKISGDRDGEE
jgi:hypothetical protein